MTVECLLNPQRAIVEPSPKLQLCHQDFFLSVICLNFNNFELASFFLTLIVPRSKCLGEHLCRFHIFYSCTE